MQHFILFVVINPNYVWIFLLNHNKILLKLFYRVYLYETKTEKMKNLKFRAQNFAKGLLRSVPIVGNFIPYIEENKKDESYKPNQISVSGLMGFFVGSLSLITLIAEIYGIPVLDKLERIIELITKFNTKFNINQLFK